MMVGDSVIAIGLDFRIGCRMNDPAFFCWICLLKFMPWVCIMVATGENETVVKDIRDIIDIEGLFTGKHQEVLP